MDLGDDADAEADEQRDWVALLAALERVPHAETVLPKFAACASAAGCVTPADLFALIIADDEATAMVAAECFDLNPESTPGEKLAAKGFMVVLKVRPTPPPRPPPPCTQNSSHPAHPAAPARA
jgi:hypothetical protein